MVDITTSLQSLLSSLLIFSTLCIFTCTPTTTHGHRRSLHQPFFPLLSAPSPPDTSPPPPPPPLPFFPIYPSPPPPPPSTVPTFPANFSSPPPRRSSSRHLAPLLAIPVAVLALLILALAFLLLNRRPAAAADSHRLFPPNTAASDGTKLSPSSNPPAPDFLYLGTLVSSRSPSAVTHPPAPSAAPSSGSPYYKLDSPELRPLPPLSRHVKPNGDDGYSDEGFYSPGGHAASTLSSPSYSSSLSSSSSSLPPIGSSPGLSTVRSQSSGDSAFQPPPPAAAAPPQLLPPAVPLLPKRKSFSVSSQTPETVPIGRFATNPFTISSPPMRPPPPPPPAGYSETSVPVMAAFQPPRESEAKIKSDSPENGKVELHPKLKPLQWDKFRASSNGEMVWDHLKSSSHELNEEMIAALFGYKAVNAADKEKARRQLGSSLSEEKRVLDPKKSKHIAILKGALNVTKEEVCEALLEGNTHILGQELLETLVRMVPSKEEEVKLKDHRDGSPVKLGPEEKFLKAILHIPFAFKRVDAMLYIANFDSDVNYLGKSFETLEFIDLDLSLDILEFLMRSQQVACEELTSSRMFLKLLEAVLKTGNCMNVDTNHGHAEAFKLDTLLRLTDGKDTDGKTTLLHFVVQEIIKAEGLHFSSAYQSTNRIHTDSLQEDIECKKLGLQVVLGLGSELSNVKKAATLDYGMLRSCIARLAGGTCKIREVLRLQGGQNSVAKSQRFHNVMSEFLKKAEYVIIELQDQERISMSLVKDLTANFYRYKIKEEAHPFRMFMVVRDFLAVLDQVCKEVGQINERTAVSLAHSVPVSLKPTHPPAIPWVNTLRTGSSDDESSSF